MRISGTLDKYSMRYVFSASYTTLNSKSPNARVTASLFMSLPP
jgi:hypothetical protein